MVTLTVDEQTYAVWSKQTAARGISVEQWLKDQTLSSRELKPGEQASLPDEQWHQRLVAFSQRHRPTGVPLDTSRESIYE